MPRRPLQAGPQPWPWRSFTEARKRGQLARSHSASGVEAGLLTPETLQGGQGYDTRLSRGFRWGAGWAFSQSLWGSGGAGDGESWLPVAGDGGPGTVGMRMGVRSTSRAGGPGAWGEGGGCRREWPSQFWPGSEDSGTATSQTRAWERQDRGAGDPVGGWFSCSVSGGPAHGHT